MYYVDYCRIRKLTKKNNRKTQMETCKKRQQKQQQSRFLQEYTSKTPYTPEDGHVDRNM
jgi:hypothetical protein